MIKSVRIVALLASLVVLGIIGLLYTRQSASPSLFQTSPLPPIPSTPTASVQMEKRGSAYDLLRDAQKAMQSVKSYHFKIDDSADRNTSDSNSAAAIVGLPLQLTVFEGDTVPPVARYHVRDRSATEWGMVVIGRDRYQADLSAPNKYHHMGESGSSYYLWANNSAVSNPEEYLNFTLDTAGCATILGEETMDGFDAIHARYVLPDDYLMQYDAKWLVAFVRDIWIEKGTYYVRQLYEHVIKHDGAPCEQSLNWEDDRILYTSGVLTYSNFNRSNPTTVPIK